MKKITEKLKRSKLFINFLYHAPVWVLNLRKPKHITLEVSSACNLRCPFCPIGNRQIKGNLMTLEDHHKIIDLLPKYTKSVRYS